VDKEELVKFCKLSTYQSIDQSISMNLLWRPTFKALGPMDPDLGILVEFSTLGVVAFSTIWLISLE